MWKIIPSQPRLEASDEGLVRIIPYERPMYHGGYRTYGGKPRVGTWIGDRYVFTHRQHVYKVARLVCEAFHGPAPEGKPYVLHIDEDARNNRPENLKWGTQKENLNAPGFIAYCHSRVGDNSPVRKGKR